MCKKNLADELFTHGIETVLRVYCLKNRSRVRETWGTHDERRIYFDAVGTVGMFDYGMDEWCNKIER